MRRADRFLQRGDLDHQGGPKAPLGQYQVRLKVGDYEETHPFELKMNPNLKGITAEDLQEQFKLASQIRDKTSLANETVIDIRKMRKHLHENSKLATADLQPTLDKMAEIELALYQVQNQSAQDPLNFPIKLNNRLASLRRSVENGDARPTDGAYQVFEELSKELEELLGQWERLSAAIEKLK